MIRRLEMRERSKLSILQSLHSIITQVYDRAFLTIGPARSADLASQTDDVQVGGVIRLGREEVFKVRMCLFHSHALGA